MVVQNKPKRPNKIFQTTALFPPSPIRKGIAFNLKKLQSPSLEDTLCYGFRSLKNVNKKSKCWTMPMPPTNRNI